MLDNLLGAKRPDLHSDQYRCPKCIDTAIADIRVKVQAEEIYWAVQRVVKPAYAKLDTACLSNEQKAAAYRLAMGWAITWLAQTAPLPGEKVVMAGAARATTGSTACDGALVLPAASVTVAVSACEPTANGPVV